MARNWQELALSTLYCRKITRMKNSKRTPDLIRQQRLGTSMLEVLGLCGYFYMSARRAEQ